MLSTKAPGTRHGVTLSCKGDKKKGKTGTIKKDSK